MHDEPGQDHGADRMQAKLERAHDAEIAAASAQRPEQVGVFGCAGLDELAFGRHHVGRDQIVDGKPELATEPSETAA